MKNVRVILSPEAEEIYRYLNAKAPSSKLERSILNAVNKKVELIKVNMASRFPRTRFLRSSSKNTALTTCSGLSFRSFGECFTPSRKETRK